MADLAEYVADPAKFASRILEARMHYTLACREQSRSTRPEPNPLEAPFRETASRLSLAAFPSESTLHEGFRAHIVFLLHKRLLWSYDAKRSVAAQAPEGMLRTDRVTTISFAEARRALLTEAPMALVQPYLDALESASGNVLGHERERTQARMEITAQLGLEAHDAGAMPLRAEHVARAARAFLDRTKTLVADEVHGDATQTLLRLRAAQGGEGLPSKLNHAWLRDTFPHLATTRIDPRAGAPRARPWLRTLPPPTNPWSFARALAQLGGALGSAPEESPEAAIARCDPAELHEHAIAHLFASLLALPGFHARALQLGKVSAKDAARAFAAAILSIVRLRAACVLSAGESSLELAEEAIGRGLPRQAATWFVRPYDEARRDFVASLGAFRMHQLLRDTFDEDWFRNPRLQGYFLSATRFTLDDKEALRLSFELAASLEQSFA